MRPGKLLFPGLTRMIARIAIFDFDGTLFRSPHKPDWYPHVKGWFSEHGSLNPPCVPEDPGPEWWVGSTVTAARRAGSDPETYCVLASGRLGDKFQRRVQSLVARAGLRFDEVRLNGEGSTLGFKIRTIDDLVERFPEVTRVDMWEDRTEHVGEFRKHLASKGVEFEVHHVREAAMEPACGSLQTVQARVAFRYRMTVNRLDISMDF